MAPYSDSTCRIAILSANRMLKHYILSCLFIITVFTKATEVIKPRGVPLTKRPFYDPAKDFTCLDGSAVVSFNFVNDDYCDCRDGSDEPGTSACPNGVFHCTNAGHRPHNIPSSRVNDGICDCCDGNDEYSGLQKCINNCKELGRRAREEAEKYAEILNKGFEVKQQLSVEGKRLHEERKVKVTELEKDKAAAEAIKLEREALKTQAEELEKEALSKYNELEDAVRKEEEDKKEQELAEEARSAFQDIDADADGRLTADEIKAQWVLDPNKDGTVTDEEAKIYMGEKMESGMSYEDFVEVGWRIMRPVYNLKKMFKAPGDTGADIDQLRETPPPPPQEEVVTEEQPVTYEGDEDQQEGYEEGEEGDEGDEEDPDETEAPKFPPDEAMDHQASTEPPPAKPVYDELTQKLVDAADFARSEFNEADKNVREIDKHLSDTNKLIEMDFGAESQFAPLQGQCFEYTDREYVYKLCMFDRATQKAKAGGAETNLGSWGKWVGPEQDVYSRMKYDNGLGCWNGPNRNTEVRLTCGMENQITMVSEPNRCEYQFEMTSPAACNKAVKAGGEHAQHEEL